VGHLIINASAYASPLFPTFVTPWADSSKMGHLLRIEEQYHLPACYNVVAPPVQTKIPNFTDDTLFYAFYTSPQDVLQLEVAEEL
jgi:CCR4-NOT transcription complex subunit 2